VTAVVLRGDARSLPLPPESVDLIVTSPPYWQLRDYRDQGASLTGQIGNEPTWQEYIAHLVECTREWVRVLKLSGSIFVVLGDKYANDAKWGGATSGKHVTGLHGQTSIGRARVQTSLPPKTLIGLPWRYAFAVQDELGLILRAEIVWEKGNGLPESIRDRVVRGHETIFHFVRQPQYFSATDEIREAHTMKPQRRPNGHKTRQQLGVLPAQTHSTSARDETGIDGHPLGKLPRSVWRIPSMPLVVPEHIEHARCCGGRKRPGCEDGLDHHAAYPPALAERIILGWSPSGICGACGEGRFPVTVSERVQLRQRDLPGRARLNRDTVHGMDQRAGTHVLKRSSIIGYACPCTPFTDHPERRKPSVTPSRQGKYAHRQNDWPERLPVREYHLEDWESPPVTPVIVVDPFGGTGTSGLVADVLGRAGIVVELSGDYCDLATWRVNDPGERARARGVPKPPPVPDGQGALFDSSEAAS
jgi:DNA modification methylase